MCTFARLFHMPTTLRLVTGALVASALVFVAYRARSLSKSGGVGALVVGTSACAAGWNWAIVLLAFFLSSSGLSRWRKSAKDVATRSTVEKGGARDAWQVFANGGLFALGAIGEAVRHDHRWSIVALGALAASTADTWATEIGAAIGGTPRTVFGWREVPPGTSGAVSATGTLAMCGGAVFLSVAAWGAGFPAWVVWPTIVGGIGGALADTVAGATVQERWWCPECECATERTVHDCGTRTTRAGGVAGMTNDAVNLTSTVFGALVAFVWWRMLQ